MTDMVIIHRNNGYGSFPEQNSVKEKPCIKKIGNTKNSAPSYPYHDMRYGKCV